MRVIGIVPARMASTRFPAKPLAPLLGRPMVEWAVDAAVRTRLISAVFVATPDPEIVEVCERERIPFLVTARSCRNGTERVADAMRQLAARDDEEVIINIQADEPTIRPDALDKLATEFLDRGTRVASLFYRPTGREYNRDRNRVKVIIDDHGRAFAFTRKPVRAEIEHGVHIGVYAYRRETLARLVALPLSSDLEQVAWLRAGYSLRMVDAGAETIAVDTPADLERAASALSSRA
jgi:3-deoxy-manno-octulosonate cytidylyltransferase (CMP-KDO synthetase)